MVIGIRRPKRIKLLDLNITCRSSNGIYEVNTSTTTLEYTNTLHTVCTIIFNFAHVAIILAKKIFNLNSDLSLSRIPYNLGEMHLFESDKVIT